MQSLAQQMLASAPGRPAGLAKYDGNRASGCVAARVRLARRGPRTKALRDRVASGRPRASDAGGCKTTPSSRTCGSCIRREFRDAFQEAAASLEPRERTLLRYSVVDGLTVDDLGRLFQVHRASAARWVADARDKLTSRTRSSLARRLGVRVRDQESILRLVQSQLDLSLRSILEEPDEPVRTRTTRHT